VSRRVSPIGFVAEAGDENEASGEMFSTMRTSTGDGVRRVECKPHFLEVVHRLAQSNANHGHFRGATFPSFTPRQTKLQRKPAHLAVPSSTRQRASRRTNPPIHCARSNAVGLLRLDASGRQSIHRALRVAHRASERDWLAGKESRFQRAQRLRGA
jgi:hypothetical protein